ncbi:MAG: OmpA family protein [Desulfovibrionales bacterium]|nr:OmpA family protein [Desulfovibrionales bacterium]
MKRKKKSSGGGGGEEVPAWMVTFSDLMTLLLTFFVLLLSMASQDIQRRKIALGSVSGRFGSGAPSLNDLTTHPSKTVEPGPINQFKDLDAIQNRVLEDQSQDLRFEYDRFIQRIAIDGESLFAPGSAALTPKGRALLEAVRPVVAESSYPLGLSGHTGSGRDELDAGYLAPVGERMDFSWKLSLERVTTVYQYFLDTGIPPDKLRLEAYGRFRPKAGERTPEDRKLNRRVEITLDRRIGSWDPAQFKAMTDAQRQMPEHDSFSVDNFLFHFKLPGKE